MIYFLFFIALGFSSSLLSQQHDLQLLSEEVSMSLSQRGLIYFNSAWETYKKSKASTSVRFGNCIEFTLTLTKELKDAQDAYEAFIKTAPTGRITYEYSSTKLALEQQKNIINYALMVDFEMNATLLNEACKPKDSQIVAQSLNR